MVDGRRIDDREMDDGMDEWEILANGGAVAATDKEEWRGGK